MNEMIHLVLYKVHAKWAMDGKRQIEDVPLSLILFPYNLNFFFTCPRNDILFQPLSDGFLDPPFFLPYQFLPFGTQNIHTTPTALPFFYLLFLVLFSLGFSLFHSQQKYKRASTSSLKDSFKRNQPFWIHFHIRTKYGKLIY